MAYVVEQSDIDASNEDGVVPLRGLFGVRDLDRLWESHATFRDICLNSRLPAIAQTFLSSDKINLLYTINCL